MSPLADGVYLIKKYKNKNKKPDKGFVAINRKIQCKLSLKNMAKMIQTEQQPISLLVMCVWSLMGWGRGEGLKTLCLAVKHLWNFLLPLIMTVNYSKARAHSQPHKIGFLLPP